MGECEVNSCLKESLLDDNGNNPKTRQQGNVSVSSSQVFGGRKLLTVDEVSQQHCTFAGGKTAFVLLFLLAKVLYAHEKRGCSSRAKADICCFFLTLQSPL